MSDTDRIAPYLTSFFQEWLISERNCSRNTIMSYRDALKMFLKFARKHTGKQCTELLIQDIDASLIRCFLTFIEEERGNCICSRNQRLAALRSFFHYISGTEPRFAGICCTVTSIPTKKGPRGPVDYLEREELEAIFKEVEKTKPDHLRDYTLLLFLYNVGARVQEAADLQISWLTLTKPYRVSILGKGKRWRVCPLWNATGDALRDLLAERQTTEEHIFLNRFGKPISRHGIFDIVKKYVLRAAMQMPRLSKKKISPHTFRHTTAMHLLQSGVELNAIRSWLGHSSLQTTHQYVQIDLKMKIEAMQCCEAAHSSSGGSSRTPTWKAEPDILAWLESL